MTNFKDTEERIMCRMSPHTGGKMTSESCNSARYMSDYMNKMIDETVVDGKERSISWCIRKNNGLYDRVDTPKYPYESNTKTIPYNVSDVSIGDEDSVSEPETQCNENDQAASFHTHPNSMGNDEITMSFSNSDYASALQARNSLECMGTYNTTYRRNISVCDSINIHHQKYEALRKNVLYVIPIAIHTEDKFLDAVESGVSDTNIEEHHKNYKVYYKQIKSLIKGAVDDGIIKRCSVESNLSYTRQIDNIPIKDNPNEGTRRWQE